MEQKLLTEVVSYKLEQPAYLTNNWRMVIAADEFPAHELRYVVVRRCILGEKIVNVAAIMNKTMIVRAEVPASIPEGYYMVDQYDSLKPVPLSEVADLYGKARDVETIRPDFQRMESTPKFTREDCASFVEFLNHVRQENKQHLIVIAHEAAYLLHRNDLWYKFPFELPVKGDGLVFQAYNLKLAFTEMMRYDYVFIGRDNRFGNNNRIPLVIGLDWSKCSMVVHRNW